MPRWAPGGTIDLSGRHTRWLHILAGPALFFISLTLPFLGPMSARFGFGILFWMIYWWVTVPVDIKATCLVPVLVAAAYPFMPIDRVLQAYVDKDMLLIIGMSMMTAAWLYRASPWRGIVDVPSLVGNNGERRPAAGSAAGVAELRRGDTPEVIFVLLRRPPTAVPDLRGARPEQVVSNILIVVRAPRGGGVGGITMPSARLARRWSPQPLLERSPSTEVSPTWSTCTPPLAAGA